MLGLCFVLLLPLRMRVPQALLRAQPLNGLPRLLGGDCRTIYGNDLSGTIPASWSELANLQDIIVQPGNPDLCPTAPAGAPFQVCAAEDVLCLDTLASDTAACAALPPSGSSDGGSSFPVAAVAVPVAVAGVVAAVAAGLLWRRRQRRRAAEQHAASAKESFYQVSQLSWPWL